MKIAGTFARKEADNYFVVETTGFIEYHVTCENAEEAAAYLEQCFEFITRGRIFGDAYINEQQTAVENARSRYNVTIELR